MSADDRKAEELIGQPAEKLAPRQTVADDLLGRPHTAEKSFAVDTRPAGETRFVTETPEERFAELQRMTSSYLDADDEAKLAKAFKFASEAHKGVCRKSGEPYIIHPVEVAIILADLRMDVETLIAALLHDTVEDTDVTDEIVTAEFGEHVDQLVDGVTKITRIEVDNLSDKQAATIRKMFVAMSRDIRVIVIKLADRLHNMRTLAALAEDRRIFKSRETLEIYAPIAHRLGINSIKWELEDLSFYYLEPNKYKQVARMVMESRAEREAYLEKVLTILRGEMDRVSIQAQVMGRPKHLYSIYQKMTKKGKGFSEIYDLIAVRLIVKTVKDCYSALGAVHTLWHPMPGRFKDYIAMPKFNMYQSLHTTVIGPEGNPLEVQIRTEEMHRMDEYGVAAHWRYKEGAGKRGDEALDQQLAWLREAVDWQDETSDSREFLKDLKVDLAPNEVFVFTPKGEAMSLRAGSTPVDFAYAVHTEVGHRTMGARVNGRLVPLDTTLDNGDTVEILTSKSDTAGPSRDWLSFVKSPKARNKIRQWFSKERRTEAIEEGRDELTRAMRKRNLPVNTLLTPEALVGVADDLNFPNADAVFAAIGDGQVSTQNVISHLVKDAGADEVDEEVEQEVLPLKPMERKASSSSTGVSVKGVGDVWIKLARCCMPVPGDNIIGFITRNQGVSVHRTDCQNMIDLKNKQPERVVEVEWTSTKGLFMVKIQVEALDRRNLLSDVTRVLSDHGVNIISGTIATGSDRVATSQFSFEMADPQHLNSLLAAVRKIDGVFDVYRITGAKESAEPRLRKMK